MKKMGQKKSHFLTEKIIPHPGNGKRFFNPEVI